MKYRIALVLGLLFFVPPRMFPGSADENSSLSEEARVNIIRTFSSELVVTKKAFPAGKSDKVKGLAINANANSVTPEFSDRDIEWMRANGGLCAKPGDKVKITYVIFKKKSIIFEVNGGLEKKIPWYKRIQIGGSGGMTQAPSDLSNHSMGSQVELKFPGEVPDLPMEEYKKMLLPIFDFSNKTATELYLEKLPPRLKQAIVNHEVLVGMDKQMVIMTLGGVYRPNREKDDATGQWYLEWIFGQPPGDVTFVRFAPAGDEVAQVEIMKIGQPKIVKTERVVFIKKRGSDKDTEDSEKIETPKEKPTLRRPGEGPGKNDNDPTKN